MTATLSPRRPDGRRRVAEVVVSTIAAVLAVFAVVTSGRYRAEATPVATPPNGSFTVIGHGNGHGLGLSQYGAEAAAVQGLSSWQITNFYYQYTQLTQVLTATVRVALTNNPTYTVVGTVAGMSLSWPGGQAQLPDVDAMEWMLTPTQGQLGAFYLAGGAWNLWRVVPSPADFSAPGSVRLDRLDGTSTEYRGSVGAQLVADGLATINRVSLEDYVHGVVPREMPSTWMPAALQSQAIAARSYALYAVQHNSAQPWDICDTSQCQVYGGLLKRDTSGRRVSGEEASSNQAVTDTNGLVRTYNGQTIFAQYSSSNGGWIPPGTLPYAIAQPDRFSGPGLGDPWQSWTRSPAAGDLARTYSLDSIQSISVTARDGYGDWNGRVTAATIQGTVNGSPRVLSVTGDSLASAMGLPSRYFTIEPTNRTPIGAVDLVERTSPDTIRALGWEFDPDHPDRTGIIDMFVDGLGTAIFTTTPRSDVQRIYGTTQLNLGFDVTVPAGAGAHHLCFYGWDLDGSGETLLSCSTVPN